jgi:large subunit ribosomal protein L17
MRHGKKVNHLGRQASHRNAMLSNMAVSLIENKRITTTVAKAKALKKFVEPLVTKAKTDSTHSRRVVFSYLQSKEAVTVLFGEVAEKIASRPGGYTRIIKTGARLGDAAETCLIELVDFNEIYVKEAKAGAKKTRRRGAGTSASATAAAPKAEKVVEAKATETATAEGDDLKIVEGIGPKIAEILVAKGIVTFAQLAATSEDTLKEILTEAGGVYASKDPSTWAKQAELAAEGKFDELKAWQDELNGGKE